MAAMSQLLFHLSLVHVCVLFLGNIILLDDSALANTTYNADYFRPSEYSTSMSRAIVFIISHFYARVSSEISITTASMDKISHQTQSGFLNDILLMSRTNILFTVEHFPHLADNTKRFFNVFFVDSYRAFRKIYVRINESMFDYTGYYTIVLTENTRYQYDTIYRILKDCWEIQITNVIILISIHPQARTAVYTYFPYTQFHCESVAPVILNYFEDYQFLYPPNLFPPKSDNLFNCPLSLALYNETPYMMITPRPDGTYHLNGIEGITVRVLSQRMHFTPIVKFPPKGLTRGAIRPNGTSTGAMGMLYSGEVNITMGAMGNNVERLRYLSGSASHYQSALIFAVPRGRPFTSLEKLFLPFRYIIWSCIMVIFGLALLLMVALRFSKQGRRAFVMGPNNTTPYMNMVAVCLGSSMTILPRRNFARYLLTIWMVGCIVLRNAYQGSLFQFIQAPTIAAPVQKLAELTMDNYTLFMSPLLFYLFDSLPNAKANLLASPFESNDEEFLYLSHVHDNFKGAFLTTKASVAYYNLLNKQMSPLPSSQELFLIPFTMYFRKHSCLTHAVNEEIHKYLSNGLLETWIRQFVDPQFLKQSDKPAPKQFHALNMHQVGGAFTMCTYMILGCVAVFLLEMLSPRVGMLRGIFEVI